jgi:DNA-binding CsgD family transcriptional regulator/energy-coupling factor transporter ATP-binding protein EcfA2
LSVRRDLFASWEDSVVRRPILEREHELAKLADATRDAATGAGSIVVVHGESGIGKSSLVQAVRGLLPAEGRFLIGCCDDLTTPRTLGPVRDLIGSVGTGLTRALRDGGDREDVLAALHRELDWAGHPTVLVVEDVHWADEATLDVLRYLVRRISDLPAVLVLTYRDDALTHDDPLRHLLGHVAGARRVHRLPLRPLSVEAVRALSAGTSVDPGQLYEVTSGNPFFVTEVLAVEDAAAVPAKVVDAVLARVRGLDPVTQDCLEQLAVVPSAVDRRLVDALVPASPAALALAERRGLLVVSPTRVSFRHELARRAVVDSMPAARRVQLHRRVLSALVERGGADLSRIVYHAKEAGDRDAVAEYGPRAASDAARAGAHREAAAHYRLVLEQPARFSQPDLAELLEGYAHECHTVGEHAAAVDAQRDAVELRRSIGDPRALGVGLRWLSRMFWWTGDRVAADRTAAEALAVSEDAGDTWLLAFALTNQATHHHTGDRNRDVVEVADRILALARASGDLAILSDALNTVGTSRWLLGDAGGLAMLEDGLRVALSAGRTESACRAYGTLTWELLDNCRFDDAARHLAAGIDLASRSDHLGYLSILHATLGRLELARGRWEEAVQAARWAVGGNPPSTCTAWMVLGRVRVRRGEPGGEELLARAWELAVNLSELQHLALLAGARAEAAWLRGDHAAVHAHVATVYDRLLPPDFVTPIQAELAYWLTRAGQPTAPVLAQTPYGLQAAGDWKAAAAAWQAAGCPYEHAAALAESPDPDDRLAALSQLDALGARPLAALVRAGLRHLGVASIPRGPAAATRRNPAGLTTRQLEVLRLLSAGLTNPEIADRLVLSTRTVDSHVGAVFGKLGIASRRDAAIRAAELGVLDE